MGYLYELQNSSYTKICIQQIEDSQQLGYDIQGECKPQLTAIRNYIRSSWLFDDSETKQLATKFWKPSTIRLYQIQMRMQYSLTNLAKHTDIILSEISSIIMLPSTVSLKIHSKPHDFISSLFKLFKVCFNC